MPCFFHFFITDYVMQFHPNPNKILNVWKRCEMIPVAQEMFLSNINVDPIYDLKRIAFSWKAFLISFIPLFTFSLVAPTISLFWYRCEWTETHSWIFPLLWIFIERNSLWYFDPKCQHLERKNLAWISHFLKKKIYQPNGENLINVSFYENV